MWSRSVDGCAASTLAQHLYSWVHLFCDQVKTTNFFVWSRLANKISRKTCKSAHVYLDDALDVSMPLGEVDGSEFGGAFAMFRVRLKHAARTFTLRSYHSAHCVSATQKIRLSNNLYCFTTMVIFWVSGWCRLPPRTAPSNTSSRSKCGGSYSLAVDLPSTFLFWSFENLGECEAELVQVMAHPYPVAESRPQLPPPADSEKEESWVCVGRGCQDKHCQLYTDTSGLDEVWSWVADWKISSRPGGGVGVDQTFLRLYSEPTLTTDTKL